MTTTKLVVIRQPIILRIKDIAKDIGVTPRTVRRWVSDGLLKPRGYRRIGGSALEMIFTPEEVDRFLDHYLISFEDLGPEPARGKEARAREVSEILGRLRIFAGKATAAKYEKLLRDK
jgi:DNA-binding transcriptional MerR regulator